MSRFRVGLPPAVHNKAKVDVLDGNVPVLEYLELSRHDVEDLVAFLNALVEEKGP
jgi:hypothetical protein